MKAESNILILFFTIFLNALSCLCQQPFPQHTLGYCVDETCSEPISWGRTVQNYVARDVGMLTVSSNQEVKVFVNHYGLKFDLIGVEVDGKRGYIPKSMIRETRSLRSATIPLQIDFLHLPTSLNQASSQFVGSIHQPSSIPHISQTVPIPQSATGQPQPLPSHAVAVESSPSFFSTVPVTNDFNANNPSISQLSEQALHQVSIFPEPRLQPNPIVNEFSTVSVIPTLHSHQIDPSSSANLPHSSTFLPNIGDAGLINHDSTNSPQQSHTHSPEAASIQGISNIFTPENVVPIHPSSHLKNNLASQVPPISGQGFSSGGYPHSGHFHPEPSSVANQQFEGLNSMSMDPSLIHQSAGALMDQTLRTSSAVDAIMDSSTNFLSEIQDPEEYTQSLLLKYGYSDDDLHDSESSISNSDSQPSSSTVQDIKKTDVSPDPSEATHNMVEFSSTFESVVLNQRSTESESKRENIDYTKVENSRSTDEPPALDDSVTEKDTLDEDESVDDEDESADDEDDGDEKEEDGEGDDVYDSVIETKSEENDLPSEVSVTPNEKSSEELQVADITSSIEKPSMTEASFVSDSSDSEHSSKNAATVDEKQSLTDINASISEHHALEDSVEHIDSATSSFVGQIINSSIDSIINSVSFLTGGSVKSTSVLDSVTEPSIFEAGDEFEHSAIEKDYAPKPTRKVLQDNENPNTSDTVSKTDEPDDEVFQQEESSFSKQTAEESVILTTTYETLSNFMAALRAFLDQLISFLPEPIYSYLMNLNASGISTRAVVFTVLMSMPCLFLFLAALFLKESSKEHVVIAKLTDTEHQLYLASTERNLLREDVASLKEQISELEQSLEIERNVSSTMQNELQDYEQVNQHASIEQKENLSTIQNLEKQIEEYERTTYDLEKLLNDEREKTDETLRQLHGEEETVDDLRIENTNLKEDIKNLQSEKKDHEDKAVTYSYQVSQLEAYCERTRQESASLTEKVNELTDQISTYLSMIGEMEKNILSKDNEIEALRSAISNVEILQKMKSSGDADDKTIEDKLAALLDISLLQNKLAKAEKEKESLLDKLKEKTKDCDEMKVDLLELKSEIENLKMHKERAVEDRNRAQSELNVLEKYFKEKEIQLQMELGTQLTVRQQKEMDASQAHRCIFQLEEENASYKSQIVSLKLEIEETERNLKKQIAAHEESAHKNWVAARAAERKAEELKQEVAQFRQRLTLLERERETWSNSSQSDIIKPVPQRISDSVHDISQSSNISGEFKPDFMIPRHLPPPMMHPILPPPPPLPAHGPPPLMPPSFMPPFNPMVPPPPRRPPPWHIMQDKNLDYDRRNTPSDFESSRRPHTPPEFESSSSSRRHHTPPEFESSSSSRRHHTPPEFESSSSSRRHHTPPEYESLRRRHTPPDFESYGSSRMHHTPPYYGRDVEKHSSPAEGSSHSRSSSPLPDFHNVPPSVSRHRDVPPMHPRYPGPPPLSSMPRRDVDYVPSRLSKTDDRGNDHHREESQTSSRERDY